MTTPTRLTILFDNYPGVPGLTSLWGFAALAETTGPTILFDTGSNGRVLLKNMAALGLSPEAVDLVFLSHPHWDHIGGVTAAISGCAHPTMERIVERTADVLGKRIDWAIGGFHEGADGRFDR